jgi:hypothetical protein
MNPHTFTRLLWQLPVLTWLVILLLPGVPWHSAWFGPWPVWLLASPALLLVIGGRRAANVNPQIPARPDAQVLVFPMANPGSGIAKPIQRRAA